MLFTPSSGRAALGVPSLLPLPLTPLSKSSLQLPDSWSCPSLSVPGTPWGWQGWCHCPAALALVGRPCPRGSPMCRGRWCRGAPRACPW